MKVTIIGAGNMGGAIARGLAKGTIVGAADITVSDPSEKILQQLHQEFPDFVRQQILPVNLKLSYNLQMHRQESL